MFITTVTVDAHQTMAGAVTRVAGLPYEAYVVVRRRDGEDLYFYVFSAGFVRMIAEAWPESPVVDALNLHESGAVRTVTSAEAAQAGGYAVVVDGEVALGVVASDGGTRGGDFDLGPTRGDPTGMVPLERRSSDADDLPVSAGEPEVGGPARTQAPFTAFPEVACPSRTAVGRPFDVVVGLTMQAPVDAGDGAVTVDTQLSEFDLVVTISAAGFATTRTRDVLHVVRADPGAEKVTFTLAAEHIAGPVAPALLQVDFSFGGMTCGRALRAILVTAADGSPQAPTVAGVTPLAQLPAVAPLDTVVRVAESERPPDLTITVTENDDSTQLEWQFVSRHAGIALPNAPVRRRFEQHNAKSFAMQQIRLINEVAVPALLDDRIRGVSRMIADQIPSEAWRVISEAWRRAAAEQRHPSIMIVSTDAFIPWELASTEPGYVDQTLTDPGVPSFLGAQTCVSRWYKPQPRGAAGVLNPPLPPAESVTVRTMTLVIGDYLAIGAQRQLPMAMEEGNELAALYRDRVVRVAATAEQLDPLFGGRLLKDGRLVDPDVVHFACHGAIDPNPQFNGIILNDGNVRLDAVYVRGSRLRGPFVFLNACQVGQATGLLDSAGGFATAFLTTGATGFIAPLWSVDDQIAKDTALGFYKAALAERVPVAEIMRRRRAAYDPDAAAPESTHLAYVYYGHPNLVLAGTD